MKKTTIITLIILAALASMLASCQTAEKEPFRTVHLYQDTTGDLAALKAPITGCPPLAVLQVEEGIPDSILAQAYSRKTPAAYETVEEGRHDRSNLLHHKVKTTTSTVYDQEKRAVRKETITSPERLHLRPALLNISIILVLFLVAFYKIEDGRDLKGRIKKIKNLAFGLLIFLGISAIAAFAFILTVKGMTIDRAVCAGILIATIVAIIRVCFCDIEKFSVGNFFIYLFGSYFCVDWQVTGQSGSPLVLCALYFGTIVLGVVLAMAVAEHKERKEKAKRKASFTRTTSARGSGDSSS
jgi:hypothetical protein